MSWGRDEDMQAGLINQNFSHLWYAVLVISDELLWNKWIGLPNVIVFRLGDRHGNHLK